MLLLHLFSDLLVHKFEGIPPDPLPVFNSQTQSSKVTFFAYNAGSEGVWFTYQGTRIVFNGTAGHFTGIIDTVSDGTIISTMNANTDSPFIKRNSQADLVFLAASSNS